MAAVILGRELIKLGLVALILAAFECWNEHRIITKDDTRLALSFLVIMDTGMYYAAYIVSTLVCRFIAGKGFWSWMLSMAIALIVTVAVLIREGEHRYEVGFR